MENPLDTASGLAESAGQGLSGLLAGLARLLEHLTGDAISAAIFAGFLFFSLSLIKGAGSSKNLYLYSRSILSLGVVGGIGYLLYVGILSVPRAEEIASVPLSESEILQLGLQNIQPERDAKYLEAYKAVFLENIWFLIVFVVMTTVGAILSRFSSKDRAEP